MARTLASLCVLAGVAACSQPAPDGPLPGEWQDAHILLTHSAYPDAGASVTAAPDELVASYDVAVVDTKRLQETAFSPSASAIIAVEGAMLHAFEVEHYGRVHCGIAGPGPRAPSGLLSGFACLYDSDDDGAFDMHFLEFNAVGRNPLDVDSVRMPERLRERASYSTPEPGEGWSMRREMYLKPLATFDTEDGTHPMIAFDFRGTNADGAPVSYERSPWLGNADTLIFDGVIGELGACLRVNMAAGDWAEQRVTFEIERAARFGESRDCPQ